MIEELASSKERCRVTGAVLRSMVLLSRSGGTQYARRDSAAASRVGESE